ncbi:MAG: biotin--[acetyl-CoA-carboxylase] ligase [Actinomycetota bacterium]
MDEARLRKLIAGNYFITHLEVHERLDSTNSRALELAVEGAAEGAVVVADYQSAGRGRRGRSWIAPAGSSLLFTVLLRPGPELSAGPATFAVGVAACEVVRNLGCAAGLKWPNDLVVEDRKLAGMLTEVVPRPPGFGRGWRADQPAPVWPALAVGFGLNVDMDVAELPEEVAEQATSLGALDVRVEREALLADILAELGEVYRAAMLPGGGHALMDSYRARSATIGRRVRVETNERVVEGLAEAVDEEGALVMRDGEGKSHRFISADVVHLR